MFKIILGLLFIIVGIIYLIGLSRRRSFEYGNTWDKSMAFKGWVGGLGLILIGVFLVLSTI